MDVNYPLGTSLCSQETRKCLWLMDVEDFHKRRSDLPENVVQSYLLLLKGDCQDQMGSAVVKERPLRPWTCLDPQHCLDPLRDFPWGRVGVWEDQARCRCGRVTGSWAVPSAKQVPSSRHMWAGVSHTVPRAPTTRSNS